MVLTSVEGGRVPHRENMKRMSSSVARIGIRVAGLVLYPLLATLLAVALSGCNNPIALGVKALQVEALSYKSIPNAPTTPIIATVDGPAGSGKVLVTWNAVQGALSYDVYYSATVSPPALPNGGTNISSRSCTISSLTNWTNYYFWVIAKNSIGSSALSIPPAIGASGIKVTSISLNKPSATLLVGSSETLTVTYTPSTASIQSVNWGTSNTAVASVSSGTITGGNTTGSATITATAADGNGAPATFTATTKSNTLNTAGPAGGILFYDKGSYSDGWRYMETAPSNVGASHAWFNGSMLVTGASGTAIGTGLANTLAIIAVQGTGAYFASDCRNCNQGGYSDWFMPSWGEGAQLLTVVNSIKTTDVDPINYPGSKIIYFYSSSQIASNSCYAYKNASSAWLAVYSNISGGSYYITRPIRQF